MKTWIFEPGHTELQFRARHMMVTWVSGLFKDIHGRLEFDWQECLDATFEGRIDARKLWTGQPERDEHLRSADFFDVEKHPEILFSGRFSKRTGAASFVAVAETTIRGVTKPVEFELDYLGEWETPFWVGNENRGAIRRIGFTGRTQVNRHDFNVSWQDELPGGGVVASNEVDLVLDVEAMDLGDLEETGAISYYRD